MTEDRDDRYHRGRAPDKWSDTLAKWITIAVGIVVLIGAVWGSTTALNGGFKSGNEVAVDHVSDKLNDLTNKFTDLANNVKELQTDIRKIPRESDFAAADDHLKQLDKTIGATNDRITLDEIAAGKVMTRVDTLEDDMRATGVSGDPNIRQPRVLRRDRQ